MDDPAKSSARMMMLAMKDASVDSSEADYLNYHGSRPI
jgi:3-oxoacyl-(acyl-carrier-protein) synthase